MKKENGTKTGMDRRDFLKTGAVTIGAGAVAASGVLGAVVKEADAAEKKASTPWKNCDINLKNVKPIKPISEPRKYDYQTDVLVIGFGVGGALLTRLQSEARVQNFLRYFTKQGDYTVSPVPITLKGTVRKPKFDGDRFLTELAKASAANLLQQAVQQPSGAALGTLLQGVIGQNGTPPGYGANGTSSGPAGQGTTTGGPGSQTQDATRTDGSSQGKPGALSLPEVLVPFVLGGAGSAGAAQGDGDRRLQTPRRLPGPNARPQD